MNFIEQHLSYRKLVEARLLESLPQYHPYCSKIKDAMAYSLMAGGKRLRPVLALATAEIFGCPASEVIDFGCSIEMIHTYSLIHDDLPAMDNDDYRRGKLTNHKVFGEAMAILAGDALLNLAYENMLKAAISAPGTGKQKAMALIAEYAGAHGMIGGQVIDLDSEGKKVDEDTLKTMHRLKTGALIKAPVEAAAAIAGADEKDFELLSGYAANLGLAFQIKDDILDVEGNLENMGKAPGNDKLCDKSTYITLYGLEQSKKLLKEVTDTGVAHLDSFGERAEFLRELALSLVNRDK